MNFSPSREKYDALIAACHDLPALRTAVVHPCDDDALTAALQAAAAGLIDPLLVGPEQRIPGLAASLGLSLGAMEVVDQPHSNAISATAAAAKHLNSAVAGDADILLVPNLESGNMLAKELTFLAGADIAGIVLGVRVPVILTSRADSVRSRLASCAEAALYRKARRLQPENANT
jgi:phosphotransacetylase